MKDVAKRQNISLKYLERILPALVREHFIEGIQGKGGGYRLTRPAEEYRIGDILRLAEGDLAPVACLECGAEPCENPDCKTRPLWIRLDQVVQEYLSSISLADLMASPPKL